MELDMIQPLSHFGVAGLMGVLWVWERLLSRRREAQLDEAHERILRDTERWKVLVETVNRNTQAMERCEQTQRELRATLQRLQA